LCLYNLEGDWPKLLNAPGPKPPKPPAKELLLKLLKLPADDMPVPPAAMAAEAAGTEIATTSTASATAIVYVNNFLMLIIPLRF
jgi:hypothetical protein